MRDLTNSEISSVNGGTYTKEQFQQAYGVPTASLDAAYKQYLAGAKPASTAPSNWYAGSPYELKIDTVQSLFGGLRDDFLNTDSYR